MAVVILTAAAITACSGSESSSPLATSGPTSTSATPGAPGTEGVDGAVTVDGDPTAGASAPTTTSIPPAVAAAVTTAPAPTITVVDLAEVGTPGLDSGDRFCSSWSRFAGSFQVVAVTAAFGSGPPERLAALEVAAAPTVTAAYDSLFEVWPVELEPERELVADRFLGPFARRLIEAAAALDAVGADDATIDTISEAWLAGLAQRDPSTPEFVIDLPPEAWATIDQAAEVFASQRVSFSTDPSLVTDVRTPLTDEYLAISCPDQGTLSGQEVEIP